MALALGPSLEWLNCSHCKLGAEGFEALARPLPRWIGLKKLDCSFNPGPAVALADSLAVALHELPRLKRLDISGTGLSREAQVTLRAVLDDTGHTDSEGEWVPQCKYRIDSSELTANPGGTMDSQQAAEDEAVRLLFTGQQAPPHGQSQEEQLQQGAGATAAVAASLGDSRVEVRRHQLYLQLQAGSQDAEVALRALLDRTLVMLERLSGTLAQGKKREAVRAMCERVERLLAHLTSETVRHLPTCHESELVLLMASIVQVEELRSDPLGVGSVPIVEQMLRRVRFQIIRNVETMHD